MIVDELLDRLVGGHRPRRRRVGVDTCRVRSFGELRPRSARPGTTWAARRRVGASTRSGWSRKIRLKSSYACSLVMNWTRLTCSSLVELARARSSICARSASAFMKISNSTPFFHLLGAVVDPRWNSRIPPSSSSDTVTVRMPGQRHEQVAAQRDHRLAREVPEASHTSDSAPDAVDAAGLVAHERARGRAR